MQDPNASTPTAHDELCTITLGPAQLRAAGRWSPPSAACSKSAANEMRSELWREEGSSLQDQDHPGSSAQHSSPRSMSSLEHGSNMTTGLGKSSGGNSAPSAEQQRELDHSQWHSSSSSGSSNQQAHSQHEELPRRRSPLSLYSRAMSQSFLAVVLCTLLLSTPIQAARSIEAPTPNPQVCASVTLLPERSLEYTSFKSRSLHHHIRLTA